MTKACSLTQDQLKAFEERCVQDAPPACQTACPLHLDARTFAAHMRDSAWTKAGRLLDKALPFAALTSALCERPCEQVCPRKDYGGAVALHDLERACIRLSGSTSALKPLPDKGKTTIVLGAGFAGLAAAWELALKGFRVRVAHGGETPASCLETFLHGHCPEQAERSEVKRFLADALDDLRRFGVDFQALGDDGADIALWREAADALIVDVSALPELAPDARTIDPVTGAVGDDCALCYGGFAPEVILRVWEGRRAAITAARVLGKTSPRALRAEEGPAESRLYVDVAGLVPAPRLRAAGAVYSADEAAREAARCLPCQCLVCVRHCAYLDAYGGYPKTYARQMFLNMGIYTGYRRINRQINSCALCRQCETLCPDGFSMADLCLLMRGEMVRQGKMPPSAHAFALEELAAAAAPDSALALGAPGGGPCAHAFFPGCQLAGARGGQSRLVFRHLAHNLDGGVGFWLRCCGAPAHYAARSDLLEAQRAELSEQWQGLGKPRVILACASCMDFFRRFLPEIPVVSLWEALLREAPLPAAPPAPLARGSLHDPCPARHDALWQEAVRGLLRGAGIGWDEPETSRETTACCGYGGLVWNANPEMSRALADDRAKQLHGDALCSCIMCRESFVAGGKASWHLFDLLLPPECFVRQWLRDRPDAPAREAWQGAPPLDAAHSLTRGPGLSQRRDNRVRLREALRQEDYGLPPEPAPALPWELIIEPDLLEALEAKRLTRQDIAGAILGAEAAGTVFRDRLSGDSLARHRPGPVAFWVRYRKEGDARRVRDAWLHRTDIVVLAP
jgi:Fe-S oxidoreductase